MEHQTMKFSQGGDLEITIYPDLERVLIEGFSLEIELLQGSRKVLPNGQIRIQVHVTESHKCYLIRRFMHNVVANSQQPLEKN